MKTRFSTLDICAALAEINDKLVGLRLANVYDVNNKTYLFKLAKPDVKAILLVESGIRMHLSEFDWPKNAMPSGFSFKLRKHLRGRRLVSATQLGIDRIVDLQFGSNEAAYHVIIELYDRGNIALTDHEYTILNLLRFRKDVLMRDSKEKEENDDVRFAVHEKYPMQTARLREDFISLQRLTDKLQSSKKDSIVKRVLNPILPYGAPVLDHCLVEAGFSANCKVGLDFSVPNDVPKLHEYLRQAEQFLEDACSMKCKGYIIQKKEKKSDGELLTNVEFQPFLFAQHTSQPYQEFPTFNKAVDEFFGSLESQKQDLKALQYERSALKKLDNVRRDHENRINSLKKLQEEDKMKACLIEANLEVVDQAIRVVCNAIANQVDWNEINRLVQAAQSNGDRVACLIKSLKLETNTMVMQLSQPSYEESSDDSDYMNSSDSECELATKPVTKPVKINIDLSLTAYANAQRYYNMKRQAYKKEQRTLDASEKAFKSAEKKTKQTLKEVAAVQNIQKARKVFWFEKFLWFVSSENYLIIGGRDAQQNELLVKKYLNAGDVYVHADLHGATSCIIKNPTGLVIPPKTLNEAGTMAICHSAAWDARVVTSAWWVGHDQVSKTAPSGEYLTTGSFLIRGKKNYLPPSYLVYGFGFLFKVDETSVWRHKGERKARNLEDDLSTVTDDVEVELDLGEDDENDSGSIASLNQDETDNTELKAQDEVDDVREILNHLVDDVVQLTVDDDVTQPASDPADAEAPSPKEEDAFEYPDTVVKMQYEADDKYNLTETSEKKTQDDAFVFLGDDTPVPVTTAKSTETGRPKMSAKQKRELRKQKKQSQAPPPDETHKDADRPQAPHKHNKSDPPQGPEPSKRGKKNKLKKLKEKYKDQDEEERKLKMEILQSANAPKVKNKKSKGKGDHNKPVNKAKSEGTTATVAADFTAKNTKKEVSVSNDTRQQGDADSDEEKQEVLKEEHLPLHPVLDILDSLTGCPVADDVLLFAIPVCAPYNSMQNFKFKVKLTPGTGKKGKAAKTAIGMFMTSRETSQAEKDHLRSVKDHDLSRNMPGKVKVSAPNLQRQKQKAKRR